MVWSIPAVRTQERWGGANSIAGGCRGSIVSPREVSGVTQFRPTRTGEGFGLFVREATPSSRVARIPVPGIWEVEIVCGLLVQMPLTQAPRPTPIEEG